MSHLHAQGGSHRWPTGWLLACLCVCAGLSAGCDDFRPPEPPQEMAPAGPVVMDAGTTQPPELPFAMEQEVPQGDARLTFAGVGRDHVFIPDPVDHAVSVIALDDGSVREVRAGVRPNFLAVAPDRDLAVVLDVRSDTAHVIEVVGADITHAVLPVVERANAIAFTDDGRYAIVHFDPNNRLAGDEVPAHMGLTVLDLGGEPTATDVGMGLSPTQIALSSAPPRAYLRRGGTVARVVLDGPGATAETIDTAAGGAQVTLFGHAGLALALQPGGDSITVIDLESGERHTLFIEQLDGLAPDADGGTGQDASIADAIVDAEGEQVIVALAERDLLLRLQWPLIVDDSTALTRFELPMTGPQRLLPGDGGALAIIGGRAGEAGPHTVSLWSADESQATLRYALPSGAIDATPLHGGEAVLVQHEDGYSVASRGAAGSTYRRAAGPAGATLVARGELFAIAPEQSPSTTMPSAASDAADAAVPDASPDANAGRASVDRIALDSLGATREYVDSPPRALAATPDGQHLVIDQTHPGGRITILDLDAGTRRTLTGFHLTDRVTE